MIDEEFEQLKINTMVFYMSENSQIFAKRLKAQFQVLEKMTIFNEAYVRIGKPSKNIAPSTSISVRAVLVDIHHVEAVARHEQRIARLLVADPVKYQFHLSKFRKANCNSQRKRLAVELEFPTDEKQ